jgi:MFS family permease
LGTILAVGSLSGALIAARLEKHRTIQNILRGAFLFGLLIVGSAFLPNVWVYGAALPLLGATVLLTLISANTYVQSHTDSNMRGRVMGIYLMIFMGGTPIGSPLVGFMAAAFGIRGAIVVCGIIVAVAALIIRRQYISFRATEK